MDKKEKERAIVEGTLSILGISASGLMKREVPDFELPLDNRIMGMEVTEYHSDLSGNGNWPKRAVEAAWDELRKGIMIAVDKYPKLLGAKGRLEFKKLLLPSRKEETHFTNQLMQLAISMVDNGITDQAQLARYPLLKKYLRRLTLKNVGAHVEWSWNYSADAIYGGIAVEAQLLRVVQQKSVHSYDYSHFDEIWLIISTGFRLSQTFALPSDSEMQMFTDLDQVLYKSHFSKVMIYDPVRSKVYLWPGWGVHQA